MRYQNTFQKKTSPLIWALGMAMLLLMGFFVLLAVLLLFDAIT